MGELNKSLIELKQLSIKKYKYILYHQVGILTPYKHTWGEHFDRLSVSGIHPLANLCPGSLKAQSGLRVVQRGTRGEEFVLLR
jgi:hypothetical protein